MLVSARICRGVALILGTLFASVGLALADGETRTWTDSTGEFKVEARFVAQDKEKVTLEGKDGKRFEIEIAKLSALDQKHLAEIAKKSVPENPFRPVPADKLVKPDWSQSRLVDIPAAIPDWKVKATPGPELEFKSSLVPLPARQNFWEGCTALVVNPRSRRALVGYQWNVHNPGKINSRMLFCDMEKGEVLNQVIMDDLVTPLAIDDDGSRALFKRTVADKDQLELWSFASKKNEKLLEFSPADGKGRGHDIRWAVFLDQKRLLTASYAGGLVVVWELPSLKPIYHVVTQGSSVPALSADHRLLAFTTGQQLGILDVDAGKVLAVRPTPSTPWAALAFSPGGKGLACGSHNHLYVWDVATGELQRDILVNPLDVWGQIAWPNDRVMLIGGKSLMDLDLTYRFWEFKNHNHVQIHGPHGWFVTHDQQAGALVPALVPSAEAMDAYEKAMPEIVFKSGVTVKLDVSALPDEAERAKVAKALEEKLLKHGCKVGAEGSIELIATADVGKTIELNFVPATGNRRPFPIFAPGRPAPKLPPGTKVRTVNLQEHFARLKFVAQGKTVWETSADNVPKSVQLEEGETLDQRMKKLERPNYDFYRTLELPRVLHQGKGQDPLGSSQVSNAGLK